MIKKGTVTTPTIRPSTIVDNARDPHDANAGIAVAVVDVGTPESRATPQLVQNLTSSGICAPHAGQ
jgi:hypothetical protein